MGDAQRALLDYFIGLRVVTPEHRDAGRCDTLLAQVSPGRSRRPWTTARWKEAWRGSRPGDKSEALVLYRRYR